MRAVGRIQKLRRAIANLGAYRHAQAVIARDRAGERLPVFSPLEHLQATSRWLEAAIHAARKQGGVSAAYHLRLGWLPPFPETTGYIIPSLCDYARFSGESRHRELALGLAEWELRIQLPDGSVRTDIGVNEESTVFDTGQGLFGFVRAWEESGDDRFLNAARRAGDWLCERQDDDGCWRRSTFRSVPHTYNTRCAWALLRLADATRTERYREAGRRNLVWALSRQDDDGWFQDNAFIPGEAPLTHTIAYAVQGLLEGGLLLADDRMVACAAKAALPLKDEALARDFPAGTYARGWRGDYSFSCLTGNAQLAIVFLVLESLHAGQGYGEAARKLNAALRSQQDLNIEHPGFRGGIKGSWPVYGAYSPLAMLNWAAKFFLDSSMLEIAADRSEELRWARSG